MNTPLLKGNPGFFEKWLIVGPGQGHTPLSLEHLAVPETKEELKNTMMAIYQRDIRANVKGLTVNKIGII